MSEINRLGNNIRSLRKVYNVTQEQLGEVLHIEKNTVSSYERGTREPSKETIRAIAKYFMISTEELLYDDFTPNEAIHFDKDAFLKNLDRIFPIATSDKAPNNPHFIKAYEAHKAFFEELPSVTTNKIGNVINCYFEYSIMVPENWTR